MKEIWKSVVGYEGLYDVSNKGRVRSYYKRGCSYLFTKDPRILSAGNVRGYQQVNLRRDGLGESGLVHRLVALAFIGTPPANMRRPTVNHKDYEKSNNTPENLEWISQSDNVRYSSGIIPRNRGEANHSKLKEPDVVSIRARYAEGGVTLLRLADEYGVSQPTIHSIVKRRKWRHLP